jgi:hypothetical protein
MGVMMYVNLLNESVFCALHLMVNILCGMSRPAVLHVSMPILWYLRLYSIDTLTFRYVPSSAKVL